MALKSSRIVDFGDKSSGFADLKNTVDRGSAESFGPVSGIFQSRSSDFGSDHQFPEETLSSLKPFSTTKVPKAMTVFKNIRFDAASIPVSGEVW